MLCDESGACTMIRLLSEIRDFRIKLVDSCKRL